METGILHLAQSLLSELLPLRVLATRRTGNLAIELLLETPDQNERRRLSLDVAPEHSTLHLSIANRNAEVEATGGFGSVLPGAFLVGIRKAQEPRVAFFDFDGRGRAFVLAVEWVGAAGNIRLLDSAHVVLENLARRGVAEGESYREPTPDPRPSHPREELHALAISKDFALDQGAARRLSRASAGLTHARATDLLLGLRLDPARGCDESTPHLYVFPRRAELVWIDERKRSLEDLGLPAAEVTLGELLQLSEYEQPADADLFVILERVHRLRRQRRDETERRHAALGWVANEMKRLHRLRKNLLEERHDPEEGRRLRRAGEAILANFAAVKRGDIELVAPDYAAAEGAPPIHIALDPAKSAKENAEDYFRRARRWDRGEPHRKRRLAELEKAVARLSLLESRVQDSDPPPSETAIASGGKEALGLFHRPQSTFVVLRSDASPSATKDTRRSSPRRSSNQSQHPNDTTTTARIPGGSRRPPAPSFHPRSYQTHEGWTVLVGRSNTENDHVTHVLAHPEDYWFHAHGCPGSHVVLRREGRKDNPSARTLEEAAGIAAFFSKARSSGKAPVVYTLKKYVRKPRKAKAGLAVLLREKVIMVAPRNPDEGRVPEWMEEGEVE